MVIFKNGKIILPDKVIGNHCIAVDDEKIIDIYEDENKYKGDVINCEGNFISPGFIDIHVHGGGESDFLDADKEAVENIIKMHTKHGTTGIYPTTLACESDELFKTINAINEVKASGYRGAEILGIHLEGPYLNVKQCGAQDPKYIKLPDVDEYNEILNYSSSIKRMTIAPELNGALDLIDELNKRGIVASIGHSSAEYEDVAEAQKRGVNLVTHLYSGMDVVHRVNAYRKLGVVESALLLDEMSVEVIADGCHLPVELLKLIYKIKGPDKIALVTDAMRAAGREEGESILGSKKNGQKVILKDGVAFMTDFKAFAGSIATTDRLVRIMYKKVGVEIWNAVKMASLTPAKIMGCDDRKGSIEPFKDADLIIFDDDINIKYVMCKGSIIT